MRFLEPIYLGLLPIALLGVWWMGRRMLGMSRVRKRLVLALRCVVITLLLLALAAPQAVQPNRGVCVIFALDLSDSISDRGRQAAKEYLKAATKNLGEHDVVGLVVFGRDALVDFMPAELRELPTTYSKPEPDGTNIAAAIRLASTMFPDGKNKRIVLLSDGNETEGSAQDAALVAAAENIEIDVVQLAAAAPDAETLVLETQAPSEVKIGEPFNLRVVLESRKAAEGTLVIDRDGEPVKRVSVKLAPGRQVVIVPLKTEREGFHRYRVSLEVAPDGDARNNIGRAFVRVRGKPRVLLAEGGAPDPNRALVKALQANNLEVTRVNPNTFPTRAQELQNYDAILLHDYPAVALSPQMMLALQSAVRDTGIGFAMIGGENSFLPGGYYETPIAEILPVDLDVRQRKVFPPATVVIIVDISGSMAVPEDGIPKIQLAAKAAIESLKLLRPQDQFGVIVSGTGVDWLAPIRKAENRDAAIAQISQMYAGGGGIYVRPSLLFAESALTPISTTTRHVILLADGDDCDEQEGTFEIANRLRRIGVTMSVVSLGRGKDVEYLRQLARVAGGNFYLTDRARDLPRLFTADVALMTRSAIEEGAFIPKVSVGEEMLQGVNWRSTPPLLAYDLTSDRPLARTLMRTHKDDPLLAVWQYGLGQSLAFTSDAKPKWAQRWVGWSEFAPFWTQITRSILRKGGKQDYQTTVRMEGGQAVVEMQAFTPQGEPINFLQPEVRVGMPTGEGLTMTLQQESPGRYVGRFPARGVGDYTLTIVEKDPDGTVRTHTTGFAIPYPSEYRFTRANLPLLTRIAETTGGQVNPQPAEAFRPVAKEGRSTRDLWRTFLWLALALLLLDITLRRVMIPINEWLELLRRLPEKLLGAPRARRPAPQAQATARLLGVKERVGTRRAEPYGATTQPQPAPVATASVSEPENLSAPPKQTAQTNTPTDTTSRLLEIKKRRRQ
ncbi:MAG: VWA domain-containing protein [Fimbriimonadales bacterium]|nr:MAG: VWA domain-containing protein [Fimbriimonadales bacterium]